MAVKNSITKTATQQKKEVAAVFTSNGMEVKLTPELVRNYLVSGDKERVTTQEVAMFINLCKYSGLNPWLKEAYCIKYGTEPATMVTGKEAFMKRAEAQPDFDGMQAGIIVVDTDGEIQYRDGAFAVNGEQIVGGWAEVFRKGRTHSTRVEVSFEEYAARKKDGSLNQQWRTKPATMIRKVAQVQALREAFPTNMGGMYAAEEVGTEEPAATGLPASLPDVDSATGEVLYVNAVDVQEPKPEPKAKKKAEPAPQEPADDMPEPVDPFAGM